MTIPKWIAGKKAMSVPVMKNWRRIDGDLRNSGGIIKSYVCQILKIGQKTIETSIKFWGRNNQITADKMVA